MLNLIFDFDGVIGDTYEANIQARIRVGVAKTREESIKRLNSYFDNRPTHTRSHALSDDDLGKIKGRAFAYGQEVIKIGFSLFDGFVEEIKRIPNARIAIVSTGSIAYIKDKIEASGLKPTHVLTFEDHHSKEEKIERISRDWEIDVKDAYYFTDSLADVYELENFLDRKKIIGCSWGFCGYEKLKTILPEDQILNEFKDIRKVLGIE